MASIGDAWVDGAWVESSFASGAWQSSSASLTPCSSATGDLLQSFTEDSDSSYYQSHLYSTLGESLDAGEIASVSGFCLRLRKIGSPVGTFTAEIYEGEFVGEIAGIQKKASLPALATGLTYDASGVSTSPTNYWFPVSYTPAVRYIVVVLNFSSLTTNDLSNSIGVIHDTTGTDFNLSAYSRATIDDGAALADAGFKIYGTSSTVPDPSFDFGSRVVVTVSKTLSSDETNALKVDVSELNPEEGTGRPVSEVVIEQVKAVTSGIDVDILWDAASPQHCLTLSGDSNTDYDFRAVGPLTNNAGSGKTGDILFSTNGATSGSSYSVTLVMRKKY